MSNSQQLVLKTDPETLRQMQGVYDELRRQHEEYEESQRRASYRIQRERLERDRVR